MSSYFLQCTDFGSSSALPRTSASFGASWAPSQQTEISRRIQPDCLCKIFVLQRASFSGWEMNIFAALSPQKGKNHDF
jgi:hypothetical protein